MTRPTILRTIDQLTQQAARQKRREEAYLTKHPDCEPARRAIAYHEGELQTLAILRKTVPVRTGIRY